MKHLVKYTTNIDEKTITNTYSEIVDYFYDLGLDIEFDLEAINLDESIEHLYETKRTWSFLRITKTKSISTNIMMLLSEDGYDVTHFIVDQKKSVATSNLRGQHSMLDGKGLIEIYSKPKKYLAEKESNGNYAYTRSSERKSDFSHDEYVIIHEILHDLEKRYLKTNRLHKEICNGDFDTYAKFIVSEVVRLTTKKKASSWKNVVYLEGYGLKKEVEDKVKKLFWEMMVKGMPMRVLEGYRSPERQTKLYNQGRTTKGNIVTNAKAGQSNHQLGIAVDCNFLEYGWNPPSSWWTIYGQEAEKLGFTWGGNFRGGFKDRPHIELKLTK